MNLDDYVQCSKLPSNVSSEEPFDVILVSTLSIKQYDAYLNPEFASSNPTKKLLHSASFAALCIDGPADSAKMQFAFSSTVFCITFLNSGLIYV